MIEGKQLADGQLPYDEGDLWVTSADTRAFIKGIICTNTSTEHSTAITLFLQPHAGVSRRLIKVTLEPDEQLYFDEPLTLDEGDKIRGRADYANEVDYVISGATESTL